MTFMCGYDRLVYGYGYVRAYTLIFAVFRASAVNKMVWLQFYQ